MILKECRKTQKVNKIRHQIISQSSIKIEILIKNINHRCQRIKRSLNIKWTAPSKLRKMNPIKIHSIYFHMKKKKLCKVSNQCKFRVLGSKD
jgi:hypothetical protein